MKILILSENSELDSKISALLSSLEGHHDLSYINPTKDSIDILNTQPDMVVCAQDLKIPVLRVLDDIPFEERPILVIDGNIEDLIDKECLVSAFSGVVHVEKSGTDSFKFARTYHDEALTVDSHFNIASVTKMMTAVATFKFMRAHPQFEIDKPIYESLCESTEIEESYLKIFKTMPSITPRQLLSHTSGLRDNIGKIFEQDLGPEILNFKTVKDYTEHFHDFDKALPLENIGEHCYCNFGYQLLGLMIEAVSGNYYDYMQKNIFQPAGMNDTFPERQSGIGFALPHFSSSSLPVITDSKETEDKLEFLERAQLFVCLHEKVQLLYSEFQAALSTLTNKEDYQAFKMDFKPKLDEVFHALKSSGYFELLEENIRRGLSFEPITPEYKFYEQVYEYLAFKPFWGIINSLSLATPDGRNMYTTAENLMLFSQFLTPEDINFLTTETAPFPHNPSCRYGFGCGIKGEPSLSDFTITHQGGAPGVCSDFRIYPRQNLVITTLANSEQDGRHIVNLLEQKLIYGKREGLYFLDPKLNTEPSKLIAQAVHKQNFDKVKKELMKRSSSECKAEKNQDLLSPRRK